MKIDSHQHFWKYDPQEYPWIQSEWSIRRSFLPDDLWPLLQEHRIDGCIAVQARQSLVETDWLLSLADRYPWIYGVVGWVDLRSKDVEAQLQRYANTTKLVGVRHVVQDEPDDRFLLGPEFLRGVGMLAKHGLTYDVLIYPKQLPAAIEFCRLFPDQPMVLDHIAKPFISKSELQPWASQIQKLSECPNVYCKLSGMVTEAKWKDWKATDFRPYLETIIECFGVDRLMYGSDWPVCLLSGSYRQVYEIVADFLGSLSESEQSKILGRNASEFYAIDFS